MQKFRNVAKLLVKFSRGEELNVPTTSIAEVKIDGEGDSKNSGGGDNSETSVDVVSMTQKELVEFILPTGVQMPAGWNGIVQESDLSIPDAYLVDDEFFAGFMGDDSLPSVEPFYVTSVNQLREKYPYIEQMIMEEDEGLSPEEIEASIVSSYIMVYTALSDSNSGDLVKRGLFREEPSSNYIARAVLGEGVFPDVVDVRSSGGVTPAQITVEGESFWRFESENVN